VAGRSIEAAADALTLHQHVLYHQSKLYPGLEKVLDAISLASKIISGKVRTMGLSGVVGKTGEKNVQGEEVNILDELSNTVMIKRILDSGEVCAVVTEEEEEFATPSTDLPGRRGYVVSIDPLDGSSNIDCNVPIGTIFGIFPRTSAGDGKGTLADCLQPGRNLIGAGYVIYGPSTMMVYASAEGTFGFTLDPSVGDYLLTHRNMMIPNVCKNFSVNEGNTAYFYPGDLALVAWLKEEDKETSRPLGARYVGSLISDFHRNLLYGGLFFYPHDKKSKKTPNGKLRLLYECAPVSYIAKMSGGKGSTGAMDVLDVVPTDIHQRVPIYVGNKDWVERAESFVRGDYV